MALLLSFFYVVPDPAGKAERGNAAACVADGQSALTGEMQHEGSWQLSLIHIYVLADQFNLSKPYLSKYIKEKSGMTFQDAVKKARMKKVPQYFPPVPSCHSIL